MDDLRNAIALLFRRKGSGEMSEREFVLSASMDLRWFPPRDSQRMLTLAIDQDLVTSKGGTLRPAFALDSVEVPHDFVPTSKILDVAAPPSEDVFVALVDALASATNSDRRTSIASINAIQEQMDVQIEVAALVAAYQAGIDVRSFLPLVESKLRGP